MNHVWWKVISVCAALAVLLQGYTHGRYVDFALGLAAGLFITWAWSLPKTKQMSQ